MRKNVKKQLALRVLSTAALVAMVSSIATAAFADTYDLNKGSVDILAEGGKQYITQWENESKGTYVTDDKGEIKNREDADITLTTKNEATGETKTTSNTVTIDAKEDNTANVTLQDVHIQPDSAWSSDPAPIEIKGNGNTNLELNGDNTVLSGNGKHAAIEKADKYGTGTLTIKDDVNDNGKPKTGTEKDTTGTLVAGGFRDGAGIGGGGTYDTACTSNITITGGDITARGGYHASAGIGGGSDGTGTNIRIEGNAHVTATGDGGAAIGGGVGCGNDVTIAGNAVVNAYSEYGAGIGDGCSNPLDGNPTTNITITDNAKVHAEAKNGGAAIGSSEDGSWNQNITIEKNANVTAVGSNTGVAIGTCYCYNNCTTSIQITGGTVNAINSYRDGNQKPAIGGFVSKEGNRSIDITINSNTGDTVVNAYTSAGEYPPAIGVVKGGTGANEYILSDGADYNEDGSSKLGETHSAIINYYKDASVTKEKLNLPPTLDSAAEIHDDWDDHCEITGGTLTKVVHNRKYMEENPDINTNKLKDEDLHDWKLVGKVVEPTLEKDGYADYICSIDKCGQTKHVVLPKLTPEPSEPDTTDPDVPGGNTPDTPNKPDTPKQPDGTTPAPVTPDAPVQDSTAPADTLAADTTADAAAVPADAAVAPAAAQKVVQDAKPEAAAPAAAAAAVLPQTGANWLAVVGTALSGMFLLAAGFVLDRKNRRMN